jgi:hypothetical protein
MSTIRSVVHVMALAFDRACREPLPVESKENFLDDKMRGELSIQFCSRVAPPLQYSYSQSCRVLCSTFSCLRFASVFARFLCFLSS